MTSFSLNGFSEDIKNVEVFTPAKGQPSYAFVHAEDTFDDKMYLDRFDVIDIAKAFKITQEELIND